MNRFKKLTIIITILLMVLGIIVIINLSTAGNLRANVIKIFNEKIHLYIGGSDLPIKVINITK